MKTIAEYSKCKTPSDFENLGKKFNTIANTEKEEWLPVYYHSHCYIIASLLETKDMERKDSFLDVAEPSLNQLLVMEPQEVEAHALQSLFYTARLLVDFESRGKKFGMMSGRSARAALKIDPSNPRARYLSISNNKGRDEYFDKDLSKYCEQAKTLLAEWDDYKPKSKIHPTWGKDQVKEISESCD